MRTPEDLAAEAFDKYRTDRVADPIVFADAIRVAIIEEREAGAKWLEDRAQDALSAKDADALRTIAAALRARGRS